MEAIKLIIIIYIDMEDDDVKISVNAMEIINRYRNVRDRINFCLEKIGIIPMKLGLMPIFF